jgi:ribulose-5-phosphate 4-epimerase/fuculose-1-phosphate aldolase
VISEQGGAVVFEATAAEEIISKFPTGKAAIHQNHGLFTVGTTVEAAAFWFITMDRSCQAQLLAEAAGTPKLIPHESALYTQQLTGYADAGWFQFQPLFQEICASDPELFE